MTKSCLVTQFLPSSRFSGWNMNFVGKLCFCRFLLIVHLPVIPDWAQIWFKQFDWSRRYRLGLYSPTLVPFPREKNKSWCKIRPSIMQASTALARHPLYCCHLSAFNLFTTFPPKDGRAAVVKLGTWHGEEAECRVQAGELGVSHLVRRALTWSSRSACPDRIMEVRLPVLPTFGSQSYRPVRLLAHVMAFLLHNMVNLCHSI